MDKYAVARPLPAGEELRLALNTCDSIQSSIQHADTKAAVLLTFPAGAGALAGNDLLATRVPPHPRLLLIWLVLSAAFLTVGLAGSLLHLARCLRPRLAGPPAGSRFALASLARHASPPSRASVVDLRDEAWLLASTLAAIAMTKHAAVRSSMPWLAVTVLAIAALHLAAGFAAL